MPDIDFGRRSEDYATHRPGFPDSFYNRLETFIPLSGVKALDLATGPGVVALRLAQRGANVTGIDIAPGQIDAAKKKAKTLNLDNSASFEVYRAEEWEAPAGSLDLITAGQCWRWFDRDVLLPRLSRLLKSGGLLVIAHFDYIVQRSEVATRTEDLILKFNPGWTLAGKSGLYPEYTDQVIESGFEFIEQFCYDHLQAFSHESWQGRIRTCNGVGSGGMTPETMEAFEQELSEMLKRDYPDEPLQIWHRIWAVIARKQMERT